MQGQTPCCVGVEIEQIIFDHELGQRVVHARRAAAVVASAAAAATPGTMGRIIFAGAVQFKFNKISELIRCLPSKIQITYEDSN